MNTLRLFVQLSRPWFLLGAALLYALGAGIARYLGAQIDWAMYFLGQAWVSLLQLSTHYLNDYFDAPADQENPRRTPFSGGSGALGKGKLPRAVALWSGIACLAVTASLTTLVIKQIGLIQPVLFIMGLIFLGAFFYSIPPVRLVSTGYGELVTSIIVASLVPMLAFLLQREDFHRLLAMVTFPLTVLHLAMMLTFELPDYATDLKFRKFTIMVRLGWQRGMLLHNLLVLCGFALVGIASLLGLPFQVAWPVVFVLPIGIFQVWTMRRIESGAKPPWTLLTLTAVATFGLTAYLFTFAFWTQ